MKNDCCKEIKLSYYEFCDYMDNSLNILQLLRADVFEMDYIYIEFQTRVLSYFVAAMSTSFGCILDPVFNVTRTGLLIVKIYQ
jgi:hypothetical protein